MKKTILFIAFLIPVFSFSQSFKRDLDTEYGVMLDTVADSKLSKDQLYSNALNFVTKSFEDSRAVIELKDSDLGEVAFKGHVPFSYTDTLTTEKKKKVSHTIYTETVNLHFKCRVYVKELKYKVVLSALEVSLPSIMSDIKISLTDDPQSASHIRAQEVALNLIYDISEFLNRKPENDF